MSVNVTIHSEISEFPVEKHYDSNIKILELKKKLELITGANHSSMKVALSIGDEVLAETVDDEQTLKYYIGEKLGSDQVLKIVVKDDQATDLFKGDVPKYTISEEKYKERPNTARDFIKEVRGKLESSK